MSLRLNKEESRKFLINILMFTAPALGVFFCQLAAGVNYKIALSVALLALWGILADYFKKLSESKK